MADIDALLTTETEGACAYCGIKDYRVLTVHHINQQEPKNESYDNKIVLCQNCHQLYHQNKGPSKQDIIAIKRRLIQRTLTPQGVNAVKESYRKGLVVAAPYLVNHLVELGFLRQTDILTSMATATNEQGVITDAVYELTEVGKNLAENWDLK